MFTLCRSKNIDDVTNPSLGPTLSRNTECTVDISLRNPYLVAYENSDLQVDVGENDSLRTFTDTSYESALTFAETYCAVGVCVVYDTVSHTTYIKSLQGITFILKFRPHFTLFQMVFYKEQTEAVTEFQNLIGGLSGMYTPKNPHITSLDDTDFPLSSPNLECFASYHTTTYYEAASIADAYCSLGVVVVYDIDSHIVHVRELSKCKGPKFSPNFISFRMVVPTKESEDFLLNHEEEPGQAAAPFQLKKSLIVPPTMNIVILVVGTRGDVQPFIYLGQALQKDGHRVRLATHKEYRDDVVKMGGLEYYPLEGDPRKLSEYMVKTGGRLMPDLLNKEERAELPEKMKMLKDICYSCYPACTACDPEDPIQRPFMADAIISNPVAYGHIHVAEALSIPLHIMFPQPWSPTKSFPHPLSGLSLDSKWSRRNYISYKMVDDFTWLGLGSMINKFRKNVLNLKPLRSGEAASSLLNDNKVPISHMWSPSFVPKCTDWPDHVDVVGEFRPTSESTSVYTPAPVLEKFLAEGERPLYIGFGSMVIEDATQLVRLIKEAATRSGCRVLLQSGWTKYAADYEILCPGVMVVGAMPHDWLFERVAGVVHHGGAGTTSAGLRAGNPTFICPFFGKCSSPDFSIDSF